jgi:predicted transposase YbfD/YdcC
MEIKFTKGYDLYKERLNEWKNSTPKMKEDYEEMKKDAQVEEYKFMEKIMLKFNFEQKDS